MDLSKLVGGLISAKSEEAVLKNIKNLLDTKRKLPQSLKEFAKLPVHDLKDLSSDESELISGLLKVKTIKDLANVSYEQIVNNIAYLREAGIPKKKMELIITAAKYIVNAADYKPVEGQKVVLVGLDNAGKTALLKAIKNEFADLASIRPTQGATRDTLYLEEQEVYIHELGGQELFRKMYIDRPEQFILGTDIMVFLIDMQDGERYQEALEYLEQVTRITKYLNENPQFIILLHKCDPDLLKKEPLLEEKVVYMTGRVKEVFEPYIFECDIQISSIYNILSMTPSFPKMLKSLFTGDLQRDQEMQSIATLLSDVVDMVLALESDLIEQINIMRNNLFQLNIEVRDLSKTGADMAPAAADKTDAQKEIPISDQVSSSSTNKTRATLVNELKRLFVKKYR